MDKPKPRSDMHRTGIAEIKIVAGQIKCHVYEASLQTHGAPNQRMTAGIPDLCVFYAKGKVAFFEIKIPPDKLTKKQAEFRDMCLAWGIPYCIVNGGDQFAADIAELRREVRDGR